MASTPSNISSITLNLSAEQLEVLEDAGIDPDNVYQVNDTSFRPPIILDAYTDGWSVFFTNGTAAEQETYVEALLDKDAATEPLVKNRGITVYGALLGKFRKTSHKVAIATV